jgi:hypothetical protein
LTKGGPGDGGSDNPGGGSDGQSCACAPPCGPPFWLPTAPLPTKRTAFATAVGSDGRIYVIGGQTSGGLTNIVEAYDPQSDRWSTATALSDARGFLAAATGADGRIYAISGRSPGNGKFGNGLSRVVEAYDPNGDEWTQLMVIPTARGQFGATIDAKGRLFAVGGSRFLSPDELTTVEAYVPNLGQWQAMPPLPTPRFGLGAALGADGRIYAVGGATDAQPLSVVEAFDSVASQWSRVADLPTPRPNVAAVAGPDGRIWAIGSGTRVDAYSPAQSHWTAAPCLNHARDLPGAAIGPDGRIYVVGGDDGGTTEAYGPRDTLTPANGSTGTFVSVTASNLGANANVSVYFDDSTGAPIATGTTDGTGTLSSALQVTIPAATAAKHALLVVDDRSQYPVRVFFTVQ